MSALRMWERMPRERVGRTVRQWMDETGVGMNELAARSGVNQRTLFRIVNGPSASEARSSITGLRGCTGETCALHVVDRLFCCMRLVELFHMEPEDGGYADVIRDHMAALDEAA